MPNRIKPEIMAYSKSGINFRVTCQQNRIHNETCLEYYRHERNLLSDHPTDDGGSKVFDM